MKDTIRSYLTQHNARGRMVSFSDDESLIESGVIDSVTMVDLIAFLESTYGIVISENDMTPENFDNLSAIVRYVTAVKP